MLKHLENGGEEVFGTMIQGSHSSWKVCEIQTFLTII